MPSVGSVGDSYDNALSGTINSFYKTAVIWRQRSWPSASVAEMATLRWVDWYNNHRLFFSAPLDTSRQRKPKRPSIWWHNSIENASGKAGAVRQEVFRTLQLARLKNSPQFYPATDVLSVKTFCVRPRLDVTCPISLYVQSEMGDRVSTILPLVCCPTTPTR